MANSCGTFALGLVTCANYCGKELALRLTWRLAALFAQSQRKLFHPRRLAHITRSWKVSTWLCLRQSCRSFWPWSSTPCEDFSTLSSCWSNPSWRPHLLPFLLLRCGESNERKRGGRILPPMRHLTRWVHPHKRDKRPTPDTNDPQIRFIPISFCHRHNLNSSFVLIALFGSASSLPCRKFGDFASLN